MKRFCLYIFILLSAVAGGSCEEDVEFGFGGGSNVGFSVDTLHFDTVFSGVMTSTQRFKVYNNGDKGVRVSRVRLGSGGESGFMVNVDGVSGTSFDDVEIYDSDSLFVFVKLKAKEQGADIPVDIKDSLVFAFENGMDRKVMLCASVQDANVLKACVVDGEKILGGSKPYIIYDSLVVAEGGALKVEAGVRLFFSNEAEMRVRGRLLCYGSVDAPVVMRGLRTDKMFPYLPYDRLDGQWGGVYLFSESVGNELHYVDIHGGRYGVRCGRSGVETNKLLMTNSSVHNVASDVLMMDYSAGVFINCEFSNAKGNCVTLVGGHTQFLHCTLAQFYPWDASHGSALYFCNVKNDTIYPLDKADFINCFITGGSDDEIFGSRLENSDAAFNCRFINCAVNTDIDSEASRSYFTDCVNEKVDNSAFRASNFKCVDTDNYIYDFGLDSQSIARGLGNGGYNDYAPTDKNGVVRPTENPDAGCYQYVE